MLLNICRHFRTSSVLGIRRTLQYNKPRVFRDPAASQYPVYVEEEADETLELGEFFFTSILLTCMLWSEKFNPHF